MATLSLPWSFTANTLADATKVQADFQAIQTHVNTELINRDGSVAFTAVPSGPGTDPSSANQLTRKQYVDNLKTGKFGMSSLVIASQTGISTITDLTGFSVAVTTVASKWYRISAQMHLAGSVVPQACRLTLRDGSNNVLQTWDYHPAVATQRDNFFVTFMDQPGAGARTYKLSLEVVAGGGTVDMNASPTSKAYLMVEDLGL